MNDYIETRVDLTPCDEIMTDLLADSLCEIGYESFVPDDTGLTAYIKQELHDEAAAFKAVSDTVGADRAIIITHQLIPGRDWNSEWEKNYFQPIVVDNRCVIHSSFHTDFPACRYDIVIDPKMAFGTGHHATTSLIIANLLDADLQGRSLIDMGTGTGILAILAAMRGAAPVTAIEIDPMAHENAVENVAVNSHPEINVLLGDASALDSVEPADWFLANINRNVITGDIARYAAKLKAGGVMLLSGFYEEDVPVITSAAAPHGLKAEGFTSRDRWACVRLVKQK
jgi:ribosomal protein L11 methyltransferase